MPEEVRFPAERREVFGKAVRKLRRHGVIPANIYGRKRASHAIQINGLELRRFLKAHGPTTLIRLVMGPKAEETALVQRVQHDTRTGDIQHVDFLRVELSEPIRARIPVHLLGEAPAVKMSDGIVLHLVEAVEVEAPPAALPEAITLDISPLTDLHAARHVRDLSIPPGVKVLTDMDEPVVKIEPPRITAEGLPPTPAMPPAEGEAAPGAEASL